MPATLARPKTRSTTPGAKNAPAPIAKTVPAPIEQRVIPTPIEPTFEQIRARAYEIYLARNGAPGTPDGDWRQAEQELRSRLMLLGRM